MLIAASIVIRCGLQRLNMVPKQRKKHAPADLDPSAAPRRLRRHAEPPDEHLAQMAPVAKACLARDHLQRVATLLDMGFSGGHGSSSGSELQNEQFVAP